MIRYQLSCSNAHEFDGWFRSIADFDHQSARELVSCPVCGVSGITKRPMAPAIVRGRQSASPSKTKTSPVEANEAVEQLREFKKSVVDKSEDVGARFSLEARRIHFGEAAKRDIRGTATPDEARALSEEGIPFALIPPLPEDHH